MGKTTHTFHCHVCARSVLATNMTFRRLRAWPRVVMDVLIAECNFVSSILLFSMFIDGSEK